MTLIPTWFRRGMIDKVKTNPIYFVVFYLRIQLVIYKRRDISSISNIITFSINQRTRLRDQGIIKLVAHRFVLIKTENTNVHESCLLWNGFGVTKSSKLVVMTRDSFPIGRNCVVWNVEFLAGLLYNWCYPGFVVYMTKSWKEMMFYLEVESSWEEGSQRTVNRVIGWGQDLHLGPVFLLIWCIGWPMYIRS